MSTETIYIGTHPYDGGDWDCQCARCGSSMDADTCETCGGEGVDGHDCGEDCCCCLDPEDNIRCGTCDGKGVIYRCVSSAEYCQHHPLKDREGVERHSVQWFPLPPPF